MSDQLDSLEAWRERIEAAERERDRFKGYNDEWFAKWRGERDRAVEAEDKLARVREWREACPPSMWNRRMRELDAILDGEDE